MTLKEIREDYVRYSTNVSDLSRNLSYAGIGIIWIFKQSSSGDTSSTTFMNSIPSELRGPLMLFAIVLVLDIFQYFIQTLIWYFYYLKQKHTNENDNEDDVIVQEPEKRNIIPWILWCVKFIIVIIAYILLGYFLLKK